MTVVVLSRFVFDQEVWEKMYEKMQEVGRSVKGAKKSIATWAKAKVMTHATRLPFAKPMCCQTKCRWHHSLYLSSP